MATAVCLRTAQFQPEDRLAEVFRDLFAIAICLATLAGMICKVAQSLRSLTERARDLPVSACGVNRPDETGFRSVGQT